MKQKKGHKNEVATLVIATCLFILCVSLMLFINWKSSLSTRPPITPGITIYPSPTSIATQSTINSNSLEGKKSDIPAGIKSITNTPETQSSKKEIQNLLSQMSLEQKIGQLFMIALEGSSINQKNTSLIRDMRLGGIILLEKNISDPNTTSRFISNLQEIASANNLPPLFIAMDQEGGQVSRLRRSQGYTEFPSPMALAAGYNDCEGVKQASTVMALEMMSIGVNMDLAPVLDVNNNPENPVIGVRSFSSDPQKVSICGIAVLDSLTQNNIIGVGKHFPGHGDTTLDSHISLPVITHTLSHLEKVELIPFQEAITRRIPALMVAHIVFPAIDNTPFLPASLSNKILNYLRDEMKFDGVIFTDALTMEAITKSGNSASIAAAKSIKAGADVLVFGEGSSIQYESYSTIISWVKSGQIPMSRIDEAVTRILALKFQYQLIKPSPLSRTTKEKSNLVGSAYNQKIAEEIAQRSITVLRNEENLLPLPLSTTPKIILAENEYSRSSGITINISATQTILIGLEPNATDIERVLSASEGNSIVIVTTSNVNKNPASRSSLVKALVKANRKIVVIATGGPYDLLYFPEIKTYLTTYGVSPFGIQALNNVLLGREKSTGKLPVELPGLYKIGDGQ